jgi:hypothetical protein
MTGNRVLGRRALGRATLERQLLLGRCGLPVCDAVEQVAGLQAQTAQSWYVSLWSRLDAFRPDEVSGLLTGRRLVRAALMRSTIHLVTARDCLALRPVVAPAVQRPLVQNAAFRRALHGVSTADLASEARRLLDGQPLTPAELGTLLATRWPGSDQAALAQAARCLLCLVQVPPRGLWGRSGRTRLADAEGWLGAPLLPGVTPAGLIERYLAAFGPASVADMQAWSGLTGLGEVVAGHGAALVTFRDEHGRTLYDLPGAPLPDPGTPAPVRFLPDYDNVLLAHADRSRVATPEYLRGRAGSPNGVVPGTVLVDGRTAAAWTVTREKGMATLTVEPFNCLSRRDAQAVGEEAARLLAFTDPGSASDVRLLPPGSGLPA